MIKDSTFVLKNFSCLFHSYSIVLSSPSEPRSLSHIRFPHCLPNQHHMQHLDTTMYVSYINFWECDDLTMVLSEDYSTGLSLFVNIRQILAASWGEPEATL